MFRHKASMRLQACLFAQRVFVGVQVRVHQQRCKCKALCSGQNTTENVHVPMLGADAQCMLRQIQSRIMARPVLQYKQGRP